MTSTEAFAPTRRRRALLIVPIVVMGALLSIPTPVQAASGDYIVVLSSKGPSPTVAAAQARGLGANITFVYRHALRGYAATMSAAAAEALARTPGVAWIQPDATVTLVEQVLPTGVDRVDAELSPTAQIDGLDDQSIDVDIAILDTGVDASHPDLRVAGGHACVKRENPLVDLHGHGTFGGGIAAAVDNDSFVVGVAPGARLWGVQVLNRSGGGKVSEVICGIDWVTSTRTDADPSNDIEVANMSLGYKGRDDHDCGLTRTDAMHQAICRSVAAGVTYTVSAGNDSRDSAGLRPAAYDEVITVSALQDLDGEPGGFGDMFPSCSALLPDNYEAGVVDDTLADFSNFGSDIDLIAPGECILSTRTLLTDPGGDGLHVASGTSFSAPHVAGGAALYLANNPGATPAQVRSALIAAGSFDWDNSDDPDGIKEPLLNVAGF